jgi:hypothetical protein
MNKQVQEAPHWKDILARNGGRTTGLMFTPTALTAYFRPDAVTRQSGWPLFDFRFPHEPIRWVWPLPKDGAYVERVTSLTTTMPLPWIITLWVVVRLGVWAGQAIACRRGASLRRASSVTTEQGLAGGGLLIGAAAMAVLTVTTVGITNRYLADFFPASAVGVALGSRLVLPILARRPAVGVAAGLLALLLVGWSTVVVLSLATHLVFD